MLSFGFGTFYLLIAHKSVAAVAFCKLRCVVIVGLRTDPAGALSFGLYGPATEPFNLPSQNRIEREFRKGYA